MATSKTIPALREVEDAAAAGHVADLTFIPGTVLMRDLEEVHFIHAGHGQVLVPQPSSNLSDPLNWSWHWKYTIIFVLTLVTLFSVQVALSAAPMFPYLMEEFNLDISQASLITGSLVIAQGYANFIIVPYSNIFGRRSALLLFTLIAVGTSIWVSAAKSYGSLIAARVINGIATAPSESIMIQVVADMLFLHERGVMTGIYFTSYFSGAFIGPLISGNIALRHGWRSFFWLSTGLEGLLLILIIFLVPETKYYRDVRNQQQQHEDDVSAPPSEKSDLPEVDVEPAYVDGQEVVGRGSPTWMQFNVATRPDKNWKGFLVRDIFTPIRVFFYPIIFWAGLMLAGAANDTLAYNLTESSFFEAPPYNFNPGQVGYTNFAFWGGAMLGLLTAGPLSDWVASIATKRNNGIREAEMRLPALIPFAIITTVGMVVTGVGYQRLWGWPVIIVVGYGACGLAATSMPTIAIAYAVDSYRPLSGEIMVVATVLKNTCGFGMSYWLPPLVQKVGYLTPIMVNLALTMGPTVIGIPMYFWGKELRKLTKDSELHKIPL